MICKIVNGQVETPPSSYRRANGDLVVGYDRPENAHMWAEDGFIEQEAPPKPEPLPDPHMARIEVLRQNYRDTTARFCTVAGIPVVTKLEAYQVQAAVESAGSGPTALPLTQLSLALFNLIDDLRRFDGDTAWDRI